jgi:hypothetical protein
MREWNLKSGDPLSLILACDARLGPSDYLNDHIWELSLGAGDPPALAIQTTFGLRAKSLRLFARFREGDETRTDPSSFAQPARIKHIFPNFAVFSYSPFVDIEVQAEYWVPESHAVAGRLEINNRGNLPRHLQVDWVGQLSPNEGQRMAPVEMEATHVLCGSTAELSPVVFLTGGPSPGGGSYPSLSLIMELSPGDSRQFTWVQAALGDHEASLALARQIASRNWEAERTRLEMLNASHVDVYTGNPDWDVAFMLAQKQAMNLFVGPTQQLPHLSVVLTRQPDQGFSLCGDGSDYNHLWDGQPPLEAYYLAGLILPYAPTLAQGLLQNYLAAQTPEGFIDWKPGLSGQRSRLMAPPLLASLAWRIFEFTDDISFLKNSFPGLLKFLQVWFTPRHDRDGDGVPEWDHPMQSGSEDHPVYSSWHTWSQGIDISAVESPGLCAFLYRECQTLIRIALLLENQAAIPALQASLDNLKQAVESMWDEDASCYFDRDRDTHYSTPSEWIAERAGSGSILLQRSFDHPIRLWVRIQTNGARRRLHLFIHGAGASGNPRVERITEDQFKWNPDHAQLTGKYVYTSLERIEIQGLEPDDQISFHSIGYNYLEHSLLAPLWAGIPDQERARKLVENTITNPKRFWHPYGLQACPQPPEAPDALVCSSVNLIWNTLAAQGLMAYGYRKVAAELVDRLMAAVVQNLKSEVAFQRYYQADTGHGVGERNALTGLAPLGLFLDTLGVRLISPSRVALTGINPFPWPVTVKYRGMTILRQREKTVVIFPDGQTVDVGATDDESTPRYISLETG